MREELKALLDRRGEVFNRMINLNKILQKEHRFEITIRLNKELRELRREALEIAEKCRKLERLILNEERLNTVRKPKP